MSKVEFIILVVAGLACVIGIIVSYIQYDKENSHGRY